MFARLLLLGCLVLSLVQAAERHTILAVFAHPDDETSVGPLLARYARQQHNVYLIVVTAGQKGATAHSGIPAGKALGDARKKEMIAAAEKLGIRLPMVLDFEDQGISTPAVMEKIAADLRHTIDTFKPTVLITWGPEGFSGHIDHRVVSTVVTEVFQSQDRLNFKPRKLYYVAMPHSKLSAAPAPFNRPEVVRTVSDRFITTAVDCRDYLEFAADAVQEHKTQWTPEQMKQLIALGETALDGHVYLRLALSVEPTEISQEDDILEGL
jgi:LmbE family N-acetylglucosaminyl deacetylase